LESLRIFSAESKGRRAAGSEATPVLREKTLGAPCPLALPSPAYNLLRQGGGLRDSFLSELLAEIDRQRSRFLHLKLVEWIDLIRNRLLGLLHCQPV